MSSAAAERLAQQAPAPEVWQARNAASGVDDCGLAGAVRDLHRQRIEQGLNVCQRDQLETFRRQLVGEHLRHLGRIGGREREQHAAPGAAFLPQALKRVRKLSRERG